MPVLKSAKAIQRAGAHMNRNPRIKPPNGGDPNGGDFQVINNLVYNTCYAMMARGEGSPRYNVVGNAIVAGPDTCGEGRNNVIMGDSAKLFVQDNLSPYRKAGEDEWQIAALWRSEPPAPVVHRSLSAFPMPVVPAVPAATLAATLSEEVGAILPARDALDAKIAASVAAGLDLSIDDPSEAGGWPALAAASPYPDADEDGMDDAREHEAGLDPARMTVLPIRTATGSAT